MSSAVNLLPWKLRRRRLLRRQIFRWGTVVFLVACFAGAIRIQKQQTWSTLRDEVAALNTRAMPLQRMDRRNQQQQTELASLLQREQLLNKLGAPFEPLQLVSVLSSRAYVRDGGVRILDLKLTKLEIQAKRQASAPVSPRARQQQAKPVVAQIKEQPEIKTEVTIYGLAKDDVSLSEFVTSLRHAGVFESIELKSTDEVSHSSGLTREYRVRCVL